jgi:GST-like protein
MAFELWTSPTPNGWKVTIMVEELREAGIPLEDLSMRTINLSKGEQFAEDFANANPNNKIPVLLDGDLRIPESCAILQYLAEKYPTPLLPLDQRRWDVIPWVYWQAANLGPNFGNKLSYTRYMQDVDPVMKEHPLERFGSEALRLVRVLDQKLGDKPFVCGDDMTIADIAMYPWIRGYKWSKVDITTKPRVVEWMHRVRARPGVERGLAYGVPKDEVDQWSSERKASYAQNGATIASNESIKNSIQ